MDLGNPSEGSLNKNFLLKLLDMAPCDAKKIADIRSQLSNHPGETISEEDAASFENKIAEVCGKEEKVQQLFDDNLLQVIKGKITAIKVFDSDGTAETCKNKLLDWALKRVQGTCKTKKIKSITPSFAVKQVEDNVQGCTMEGTFECSDEDELHDDL